MPAAQDLQGFPRRPHRARRAKVVRSTTGSVAASSSEDVKVFVGFERGMIETARFELLAGIPTMARVVVYDRDPTDPSAQAIGPLYGGVMAGSWTIVSPTEGMSQTYGGAMGLNFPIAFKAYDARNIWLRIYNADFAEAGQFQVDVFVRELVTRV